MQIQFKAALRVLSGLVLLSLASSLLAADPEAAPVSTSGVTSEAPATASVAATALKVLARSDDAKFVGSKVGGLQVQVRNLATGEILAHGPLSGGTGDTAALMQTPQLCGRSSTEGDPASFDAELSLAGQRL
jgi:hypothetical protein